MSKRQIILVLTVIMTMAISTAQAQVKLVVTPKNGGKATEYTLQDIRKITFDNDGMHIIGTNITPEPVWALSDIRTITFDGVVTGIGDVVNNAAGNISISRNGDMLYVHGLESGLRADAAIFDLSGKSLLRTKVADGEAIDIAALRQGVYIIKINNATYKFVKQ